MHSILQSITVDLRKLEKRNLTLELQNAVNAAKVIVQSYQDKQNKGLAFTADDERVLNALAIIVVYMVKDSSITQR